MDVQKKIEELGSAFEQFKKANDQSLDEIKKKGYASGETTEKVEKLNTVVGTLEKQLTEINAALARKNQFETPEQKEKEEKAKKAKAFDQYLRKGIESPELKAMTVDSDQDGGFFVREEMATEIATKNFESSPVRQLASVQTISSDSLDMLQDADEVGSGWVGETETRSASTTPTIQKIAIPLHELHSSPKASQKLLDDAATNIEAWLSAKVAAKFSRDEATAFISGNGVNKPKGILNYSNGTTLQTVQRVETAANNAIAGNDLIGLQAALKEVYQSNASWLINRLIVGEIRKLKDATSGQYIWQPGLTVGQPGLLLGRPVYFAADLPSAVAATTDMLIYGDIRAAYQIVDKLGVRMLRDPYSAKPYVVFYTTKRVGGAVKNGEAVKVLLQKT